MSFLLYQDGRKGAGYPKHQIQFLNIINKEFIEGGK